MVSYGKQTRNVYYQKSTRNKSFLEMHYFLKNQGIRNNKFHLALYDVALASIDPHDPSLSIEMKQRVARECCYNYWYFIREVVRVPASGINTGIMYGLNRANLALSYCCAMNLNVYEEIPRQCGKTTAVVTYILWLFNFGTANTEISFLNKRLQDATYNLSELKGVRDLLPSYLKMDSMYMADGKKIKPKSNIETMAHPINGNIIRTVASARNATAAASLLRGRTVPIVYADEWAFVPYNYVIFPNMAPAFATAANYAKMNNRPCGMIFTSTPGVLTSDEGIYAYKQINSATKFNENIFYDADYNTLQNLISSNLNSTFVYIKYTYQQLGKSEKWFRDICQLMELSWPDIRREVLLEWSQVNTNSPFRQEDLDIIKSLVREPIQTVVFLGKFTMNIYEKYNNAILNRYRPLVGVDVSGGYNRDSSAITIVDSYTTKVIADFNCNYISTVELASLLLEILKWLPNAIVNVERNGGFGASVLSKLVTTRAKPNLWYTIEDRVLEERFGGRGPIQRKTQKTKVYGSDSSKNKREQLMEILRDRVDYHKDKIISPIIYQELCGMEVKKSGKIEHSINTHDDQVFSWLWALYMYYYGEDLMNVWGIEKHVLKTDADLEEAIYDFNEGKENIVQEIDLIDDEIVEEQLEELNSTKAILYEEWMKSEHEKDEAAMRKILSTKVGRIAYENKYGQKLDGEFNMITTIPDEMFGTGFSTEEEKPYSVNAGNLNNPNMSLSSMFSNFLGKFSR